MNLKQFLPFLEFKPQTTWLFALACLLIFLPAQVDAATDYEKFIESLRTLESKSPETVAPQKILAIDFDHAGGMTGPTRCHLQDVMRSFPGLDVKREMVNSYPPRNKTKGFSVIDPNSNELIFTISCFAIDFNTGSIIYINDNNFEGHWDKDKSNEFVQFVFTLSTKVRGPRNSVIGKTQLKEVKDLGWEFESTKGCQLGFNLLSETVVCLKDGVRLLFDAPSGFSGKLSEASELEQGNAVLTSIRYSPRSFK